MKQVRFIGFLLVLLSSVFTFAGCSDDSPGELSENIYGKWHSYKFVAYKGDGSGEQATVKISKTGEYSYVYFEFTFRQDGTFTQGGWDESSWYEVDGEYRISDNAVYTSFGTDFVYDEKSGDLYFRYTEDGATAYLYFKK